MDMTPHALTREQVEMLANGLNKDGLSFEQRLAIRSLMENDGNLRQALAQQAQEVERMKVERDSYLSKWRASADLNKGLLRDYDASQARARELEIQLFEQAKDTQDVRRQLAASQARVEAFQAGQEEIANVLGWANVHPYTKQTFILNQIAHLQATLDGRELRIRELETIVRLREITLAAREAVIDGLRAECRRVEVLHHAVSQDAARLREALEALEALWRMTEIYKITDLDAHAVISKALKGV